MNCLLQSERLRRLSALLPSIAILSLSLELTADSSRVSQSQRTYALLFGTVYGPDDRPVYGVKIRIRRGDQKKAHWELYSDHAGEFAVRLPHQRADYVIWAETAKAKHAENKEVIAHFDNDERVDISLHLK